MQVVHNLREGRTLRQLLLLAPGLLIPLGLMGVTTPSYLEYRTASRNERAAQVGYSYAQERQQQWAALGSVDQRLEELQTINRTLQGLFPAWQEELVVHGAVRDACEAVGLQLSRIQMVEPVRTGPAIEGKVVVERAISLTGSGHGGALLELVDRLRSQGWPTCVHALDANLDLSREDLYGYEVRIGIFHYAPAKDFLEVQPETVLSQIEAPIQ